MRAAPPPRRAVRAAVQPATSAPSSTILRRRLPSQAITSTARYDGRYLAEYQVWQSNARRAARTSGVARFAANMVAMTSARVHTRIEEQDERGNWDETVDPRLGRFIDLYRNQLFGQGPNELIRAHTFHYQVAGEACLVHRDGDNGTDWLVVSMAAIDFGRPGPDLATVSLIPGGQILDGTAFVVPRDQIIHFWMPDEEWLGMAVSPMTAAMEDLDRYQSLARYAKRQANNYLAMNGALWTPNEAHDGGDVPVDGSGGTAAQSPLAKDYEDMARMALSDFGDETLEAVIPPMWNWDREGGPPKWVEIGRGLDEHGRSHREEALSDFARDLEIPSVLVSGGGADAHSNHWNAWMTKDRFVGAVAPTLDRVTHQDLTVAFLRPYLTVAGYSDIERYRVGYDPGPVIAVQDDSDKALRAWLAGLLKAEVALDRMGFDPDNLAGPDDLKRLGAVLSHFATGVPDVTTSDGPAGPQNVVEAPPAGPPQQLAPAAAMLHDFLPREHIQVTTGNGHSTPAHAGGTGSTTVTATTSLAEPVAAAAHNPTGTGIMLSLDVPTDVASGLAVADGEPADAMHVTLVHLPGGVDAQTGDERAMLTDAAGQVAAGTAAPTVDLTHVERFVADPETGDEPVVLVDDGPEVYALREKLVGILDEAGLGYSDDHGFRCHVTLGYWPPGQGPESGPLQTPVSFTPTGVSLHWGSDVETFPFAEAAGVVAGIEGTTPAVVATARAVAAATESLRAETDRLGRAARAALRRLARIRRDAGRELRAMAELTFEEALRHAGVRAATRAANRSGRGLADTVTAAVEQGAPLRPFFARLGIDEERLLAGAFDGFESRAVRVLTRAGASEQDVTGETADPGETRRRAEAAAAFLAAALLTLARRRVAAGETPPGDVGEVSGVVPASLVAQALGVVEGRLAPVMPDHPDVLPSVTSGTGEAPETLVARSLRDELVDRLRAELAAESDPARQQALEDGITRAEETAQTTYAWTWGFWGEPDRPFDPHQALDGIETTDPEGDPAFANDSGWPDGDYYQPSDHDGCACELVPTGVDTGDVMEGL